MLSKDTPVKEIMRRDLTCVYSNNSLTQITEIFKEADFHHLPVVNDIGEIIGIISKEDCRIAMEQIAKNSSGKVYTQKLIDQWDAQRIMTPNPQVLQLEDVIGTAAEYFLENKFHALPILDDNENLAGIITSHDLLKYAYG